MSIAAMPLNDPDGRLFPHLRRIIPELKLLFSEVYLSVSLQTRKRQSEHIAWLKSEPFFKVLYYEEEFTAGDDFLTLYETTARTAPPEEIIHLCYLDRIAFALQTNYRQQFIVDISSLGLELVPVIFERSPAAWETHPRNYYELEMMVTDAGKWLFGRSLDYAWCHIALTADMLLEIIPTITRRDMAHVAEYILPIRDQVHTKAVDWLAWEDPFIYEEDPARLKAEREQSLRETHKRLAYVVCNFSTKLVVVGSRQYGKRIFRFWSSTRASVESIRLKKYNIVVSTEQVEVPVCDKGDATGFLINR
ncbi:MAG: hypothetical protein R3C44_15235 [Chloroflexota bacterium]